MRKTMLQWFWMLLQGCWHLSLRRLKRLNPCGRIRKLHGHFSVILFHRFYYENNFDRSERHLADRSLGFPFTLRPYVILIATPIDISHSLTILSSRILLRLRAKRNSSLARSLSSPLRNTKNLKHPQTSRRVTWATWPAASGRKPRNSPATSSRIWSRASRSWSIRPTAEPPMLTSRERTERRNGSRNTVNDLTTVHYQTFA